MRAPFPLPSIRRTSALSTFALLAGGLSGTLFAADQAPPQSSEKAQAAAEALLEEALACEIYGLDEKRDELLAKSEALAPEHPAIKWQRGLVLIDDQWIPAEEVAVASKDRSLLDEYVAKRDAAENSLSGQFALSKWCQKNGLLSQERAHLVRVLLFDQNHETARARLGFVRVGEEWISREEIAAAIEEQAKTQASIKKHAGAMHDVLRSLSHGNPAARERALDDVRAVRDVEMIPALERMVASESEEATLAVVVALSGMPGKEASLSLARFAVFSSSYKVRSEASSRLQGRPFDHFVPEMLLSMKGPSKTAETVLRDDAGRLIYRWLSYQEGMNGADLAVRDSVYRGTSAVDLGVPSVTLVLEMTGPIRAPVGVNMEPEESRAFDDMQLRAAAMHAAAKLDDADRLNLNARVGQALEEITAQPLGTDAEPWWNWWIQYDETTSTGQKPTRTQYTSQIVDIPTSVEYKVAAGEIVVQCSCFAAGTSVLTNRGDVPIEQVRIGDLALSQNTESGQLAFKPVLETTVGPAAEMLRVECEGGSFRCTGGHPFWVSGEGWVNARRLRSGMELHTTQGSVSVSEVVTDGMEPAYNLIVADFSTYFVGPSRVLCHDISTRMPTDAIVPGLEQK